MTVVQLRTKRFLLILLVLAAAGAIAPLRPAAARPHTRIDAHTEVIFDDQQRIAALRLFWRFDEAYSRYAVEGLDGDGDGRLSREELRPLAEYNVASLKARQYFTSVTADGRAVDFGPVTVFDSTFEDGLLNLSFVIPLSRPLDPTTSEVGFVSYDSAFSIAIVPNPSDPVSFAGPVPEGCRAELEQGRSVDQVTLPDAAPEGAEAGGGIGALYATTITIVCPTAPEPQ